MSPSQLVEQLQPEIGRALTTLVARNVTGIAQELVASEDGKLSVSFSLALSLQNDRVAGVGNLSYSRKFKDAVEFSTRDPKQPQLPGIEPDDSADTPEAVRDFARRMAEVTGAGSVTVSAGGGEFVLAGKSTHHGRKGGSR